ncbi:MAG TPA: hypothetical protein PLF42_11775, partial [Anaerolineales bacterium]|nr:hypothetical protein [Anaerolineales bacterium]
MSSDETVLALNPDPAKQAVRIEKAKYDVLREAILENLRTFGPMTFTKLGDLLADQLQANFDGSVSWYYTTVKLDMEARGELRRVP